MKVSYVALIEDGSDDTAFGVVFPDLPGCFSAGDTFDEAVKNAREALGVYCEVTLEDGYALPAAAVNRRDLAGINRSKSEFSDTTYQFVPGFRRSSDSGRYAQSGSPTGLGSPGVRGVVRVD